METEFTRKFRVKTGVLLHKCPACGAAPHQRCISLKTVERQKLDRAHPLRNAIRIRSHSSRRQLTFGEGS